MQMAVLGRGILRLIVRRPPPMPCLSAAEKAAPASRAGTAPDAHLPSSALSIPQEPRKCKSRTCESEPAEKEKPRLKALKAKRIQRVADSGLRHRQGIGTR